MEFSNNIEKVEEIKVESKEEPETEIIEEKKEEPKAEIIEEKKEESKPEIVELPSQELINDSMVDVEPIITEPPESQPIPISFSPPLSITNSSNSDSIFLETEKEMGLVSVKGNPKVKRCTKCNTFVSINKSHSVAECASRLSKFNANRGKRKGKSRTKKQNSRLMKKLQTFAKKYSTKKAMKKYKFPAALRNFFKSLS